MSNNRVFAGEIEGSAKETMAWQLRTPYGPGPHPVVLIHHGFKGFRDWGFFPWLADALAQAGYAALSYNTAHNGVGLGEDAMDFTRLDLFARNRQSYEVADLRTLLRAIRQQTLHHEANLASNNMALLGHSRGGAAVLLAGRDEGIKATITWASVTTTALPREAQIAFETDGEWSILNGRTGQMMRMERTAWDDVNPMPQALDLNEILAAYGDELLIIHGQDDDTVPVAAATVLKTMNGGKAKSFIIAGAGHTMNASHPFTGPSPELIVATQKTVEHLERCLVNKATGPR